MTPLKINKKIAKIKKYHLIEGNNGLMKRSKSDHPLSSEMPSLRNVYICWNPAQNIKDAWELFEEMPNDTSLSISKNGFKYSIIIGDSFYCVDESKRFFYADTAPLAICKAWISWKEKVI